DLKTLDRFGVESARGQVFARQLTGDCVVQPLFKERASGRLCIEQKLPQTFIFFLPAAALQFYACAVGQSSQCVDEFDAIAFDDKINRVAGLLASKAIEILLGRIDLEGRGFFLMKGA